MKAIVVERYGGPEMAVVKEVAKPTLKPGQVLVRVMASSVNSGDARLRRADPWFVRLVFGLFGPRKKVLGVAFAGIIEEVGDGVTDRKVGDRIYGMNEDFFGTHAEYLALSAQAPSIGKIPDQMSYVDAAALVFGGTTALHFLQAFDLQGKSMLINGASGSVGVALLQIAKTRGAIVSAVTSTENMALMRELGAEHVIDYKTQDLFGLGQTFDIVFDCVNTIPVKRIGELAKKGGHVVLLAGLIKEFAQSRSIKSATVHLGTAKVTRKQFDQMNELYSQGVLRPVISRIFTMNQIQEAYRIVDSGRKVGNIVLDFSSR